MSELDKLDLAWIDSLNDDLLEVIKFVEKKEKIIFDSCKTKKFTFANFKKALFKSQYLKYKNN